MSPTIILPFAKQKPKWRKKIQEKPEELLRAQEQEQPSSKDSSTTQEEPDHDEYEDDDWVLCDLAQAQDSHGSKRRLKCNWVNLHLNPKDYKGFLKEEAMCYHS